MTIPDNPTLNALINLLDEPDEKAFGLIRNQILLLGAEAIAPLERSLENTFNLIVQERIESLVSKLKQDGLFVEFSDWLNIGSSDLLKGYCLVSKIQYPSLDEEDIVVRIEQLKVDIWIELHENLTALENVKVMNHLLYDIHYFEASKGEMSVMHCSFINHLLEDKKGTPLSLGMLYIILAQRLGLPVFGVNLPQQFILAYLTETGIQRPDEDDVLFYINPFNHGTVFTRREIELFIGQLNVKPEKAFFTPCTNPEIIRRLIHNLVFLYGKSGDSDKIEGLEILLKAYK